MQMIEFHDLEIGSAGFRLQVPLAYISAGQATALVGRNGSGKTSLLETFLGLRRPRSGSVAIDGKPASDWLGIHANKRRVGVQLQSMAYPSKTLVREVAQLHSAVYACEPDTNVASAFDVAGISDRYYEHLSRGEKQRIDLYVALAHRPEAIFLDEPCTGLDANFHDRALQLIADLCQRPNRTVLFATHDARELQLGRGLLWIDSGVVRQTTVAEGLAALGEYCGEIAVPAKPGPMSEVLTHASKLPELITVKPVGEDRILAFGNGSAFKTAFESLAERFNVPHTLRLVSYEDLLQATANGGA
jgi:ABC-2 type transport system ATP-binding protein